MAGILNTKERVLDTIITPTGRAQIAAGELKIEYASFTDRQMYYVTASNGELEDPGARIYFESYSTDSDLIVPELDADANLSPIQTNDFTLFGGNILSGSDKKIQSNVRLYADALTQDAINSLNQQMILGTRNLLKNELSSNFEITPSEATFYTKNSADSSKTKIGNASLDDIESLWQDYRVANVANYQYLPPILDSADDAPEVLGNYTKINQDPPLDLAELMNTLSGLQSQKFTFSNTRTSNDILGQIFEVSEKKLSKLVIIDGGSYNSEGQVDPHVFYAGKLYRDTRGALTFVNIFTLVFE